MLCMVAQMPLMPTDQATTQHLITCATKVRQICLLHVAHAASLFLRRTNRRAMCGTGLEKCVRDDELVETVKEV